MKPGASDSRKDSQETTSRKGILGLYAEPGTKPLSPGIVESGRAFRDSNLTSAQDGGNYSLETAGSLEKLPGGGVAAIFGRPGFRDTRLAEVARSSTPAEALVQGYSEYAHKIFGQMLGCYTCVIIDLKLDRVLIGIDRFGQHSLYYTLVNNVLAFGSSADHVMANSGEDRELLNQGIYNYLYFHMVPSPDTIFRGLKKLPAAHYLEYQDGRCQVVNYWQPDLREPAKTQSIDRLCLELKQALQRSVERNLPDTGKVGSFLSGGLDSSTVTGVLAKVSDREAEAYSIGFSAKGYDEMAYARLTARHFGVRLNEYYVTPQDVVDSLPFIATSYDEPFGNSSALPAFFCAKMATEHGVDTLLAGDGGDEIFAGNERYIKQRAFAPYAKLPDGLRRGILEPLIGALPSAIPLATKARSYIDQAKTPLPDRLQSYNFLHRHPVTGIFQDEFLSEVDPQRPLELLRSIFHRPDQASDLNRMLYLDWQITLADNDLRKVNHMCALAGVDVAYPMLDDELVELSCRLPSNLKIKGSNLRHFFKLALKDWLPVETISKNKQGFGLPFGVWMQTYEPLREMAYDNLLRLKKREFIRPEFIDKAIEMHQSEHAAYYGELVWILTVFELWMAGHAGGSA